VDDDGQGYVDHGYDDLEGDLSEEEEDDSLSSSRKRRKKEEKAGRPSKGINKFFMNVAGKQHFSNVVGPRVLFSYYIYLVFVLPFVLIPNSSIILFLFILQLFLLNIFLVYSVLSY